MFAAEESSKESAYFVHIMIASVELEGNAPCLVAGTVEELVNFRSIQRASFCDMLKKITQVHDLKEE